MKTSYAASLLAISVPLSSLAQVTIPGANQGSDGVFNPTANYQFDLGLAQSGAGITWESAGGDSAGDADTFGNGVYDPDLWAVVFKFSSINIPANVTVTFKNNASRAPVVWLVSGSVTIAGTVSLDGQTGPDGNLVSNFFAEPGPGGFRGGRGKQGSFPGSAGFGPGGGRHVDVPGNRDGSGGSHSEVATGGLAGSAGPAYGNVRIIPLIGGSGGGPYLRGPVFSYDGGAGGGGGALLLAAPGDISLSGLIRANGGSRGTATNGFANGGSGGALRVICNRLIGTTGRLQAVGGNGFSSFGAPGRIRVEADTSQYTDVGTPVFSSGPPGATAQLWPDATAPSIECVSLGASPIPTDPRSGFNYPAQDLVISETVPQTLVLEARNVPLTWTVRVRVTPRAGADFTVDAVLQPGGTLGLSTWHATITVPNGVSAVQARAFQP